MSGPANTQKEHWNAELAACFRAVETNVNEVVRMADITAYLFEAYDREAIDTLHAVGFRDTREAFRHLEQWRDRLDFAVHHLADMTSTIRKKYFGVA